MSTTRPPLLSLSLFLAACTQLRYAEVFEPEGSFDRVEIRSDAGVVELSRGDRVRVERGVRGPEGALDLSHHIEAGLLVLEARCTTLVPCAVDTSLTVPEGVEVSVWLGRGEVWATGLASLTLDIGEGAIDVELSERLDARVGTGSVRASLGEGAQGRVSVADGDVEVSVPLGSWNIEADGARVEVDCVLEARDGTGRLELLAPAGTVRITGA